MPFRLEQITDADVAVRKRIYSPCGAKWQADKTRSRVRVNLGLAFEEISSTEGEAVDKEHRGVDLVSVGQVARQTPKKPNTNG